MKLGSGTIGRLLRLPLRAIPKKSILPVMSGPLIGNRWVVGSSVHGCWLGWYEKRKAAAFRDAIGQDAVVWDIGANVGYYTLIAAKCHPRTSRVFAFEPVPSNVTLLRRHLELNRVSNVTVLEVAVTDREGEGFFEMAESNSMGRLTRDTGSLRVRLASMDEIIRCEEAPVPTLIKMDIEGAEYEALCGGSTLLEAHQPTLFLATHGPEVHRACCELLRALQYDLKPLENLPLDQCNELVARPKRTGRTCG